MNHRELASDAILAAVEKGLRNMFANGVVVDVTADTTADAYLAKADATTDPVLAEGYRKAAKKARRSGRK